jgi:hypothetical protein
MPYTTFDNISLETGAYFPYERNNNVGYWQAICIPTLSKCTEINKITTSFLSILRPSNRKGDYVMFY